MQKNDELSQNEIYKGFHDWLCKQPYWLQDSTWRLYNQKEIDSSQINIYKKMCIQQACKEEVTFNKIDISSIMPASHYSKLTINELYDITGVNALSEDAKLSFGEKGLTVIYGLNGAGKSGYMRIFKHVCNHPCAEPIQPNVFNTLSGAEPTCKFTITHNDEQTKFLCHLNKADEPTPLRQCDAFDTRIATSYIANKNNVSYEPFVFTVLTDLAHIASEIEAQIDIHLSTLKTAAPKIPEDISDVDNIQWVKSINEKTVIPEKFLNWNDDLEKKLTDVKKLVNEEQINNQIVWLSKEEKNILNIYDEFKKLDSILSESNKDTLTNIYNKYVKSKSKYELSQKLFSENATPEDKLIILSEEWMQLWSLAKKYYESILMAETEKPFASDGSICPLCHQVITGDTFNRVSNVNEYINSSCKQEYENNKNNLKSQMEKVGVFKYTTDTIKTLLEDIVTPEQLEIIIQSRGLIDKFKEINDFDACYRIYAELSVLGIVTFLEELLNTKRKAIKDLQNSQNTEEQQKIKKLLLELKAHKWIYQNKDMIEKEIENKKEEKNLIDARKLLKTNNITKQSNDLANKLITDAYIERFSNELHSLANKVKVKIVKGQSSKGKTPYQVMLATDTGSKSRTTDVLSEGEQRIVALAAFFADATGRSELTPIIIDDPISSLDHNYELRATNRIAELAKNRQVIVFTHRISFFTELVDKCKELEVDCTKRFIKSSTKGNGILYSDDLFFGNLKSQLGILKNELENNKKKDPDSSEYNLCIDQACRKFRIYVERSVEEVLLDRIVTRFEKQIRTKDKLKHLLNISEDDCRIIDTMMSKYSYNLHPQPADGAICDFDIDEMINDVANFREWIGKFRKKCES